MIEDIRTMVWKERKGLLVYQGSTRSIILNLVVVVGMMGIGLPLQAGADWYASGLTYLASAIIPLLLVGVRIPESFAGERERKTLETLLASRMPDRAILVGKVIPGVAFGWLTAMLTLLVAALVANVRHWSGQVIFYAAPQLLGNAAASLLVALLVAGAGILFSLRAETVQKAAQSLMFTLLLVPMILQVVLMALTAGSAGGRDLLGRVFAFLGSTAFAVGAFATLIIADLALFALAARRFRRGRLIAE